MFGGQFYPYQPLQFGAGLLVPPIGATGLAMTVAHHATAVSNANTIAMPGTIQAGDLAVLLDCAYSSGGNPTDARPSNFTDVAGAAGSNGRYRVSRKVLLGSEGGATLSGMSGTLLEAKILLIFRPSNIPITNVDASTWNSQITTSNPSSQVVSAAGEVGPLIVFGLIFGSSSVAAFSTASPAFDAQQTEGSTQLRTGYKIYNSAPANHTIDANDLGTNILASGFLRLS